jgi:hypothetical protein
LIAHQRQLVALMSGAVAELAPSLPPDRLRAATMTVFGILNWFYMWHRPGKGLERTDYAKLAGDFVIAGIKGIA